MEKQVINCSANSCRYNEKDYCGKVNFGITIINCKCQDYIHERICPVCKSACRDKIAANWHCAK